MKKFDNGFRTVHYRVAIPLGWFVILTRAFLISANVYSLGVNTAMYSALAINHSDVSFISLYSKKIASNHFLSFQKNTGEGEQKEQIQDVEDQDVS